MNAIAESAEKRLRDMMLTRKRINPRSRMTVTLQVIYS
jgi:hypothetical protein